MASIPEVTTFVYRITRAPYADLSGEGARLAGGRWNRSGRAAVYSAENRALAILETLVHVQPQRLPSDLVLLSMHIPAEVPQTAWTEAELPQNWEEVGAEAVLDRGDAWLDEGNAAVLWVPSAVVPHERNAIINPRHPASAQVRITGEQPFRLDRRLVRWLSTE